MGGFQFCKTPPQKKKIYNNNPIKQNQLNACHKYLYRRERIPKGGVPPSHETDEEPRKHPAIFSQGLIQSLASLSSMKQTVGLARVTRATQKSIHHGNCEFFRRVSPFYFFGSSVGGTRPQVRAIHPKSRYLTIAFLLPPGSERGEGTPVILTIIQAAFMS